MNGNSNAVGKSTMIAGSAIVLLLGILKYFGIIPSSEEVVAATSLLTWAVHYFFPAVDTSDSLAAAVNFGTVTYTSKDKS